MGLKCVSCYVGAPRNGCELFGSEIGPIGPINLAKKIWGSPSRSSGIPFRFFELPFIVGEIAIPLFADQPG